jgi:chromosome segregation ATPase
MGLIELDGYSCPRGACCGVSPATQRRRRSETESFHGWQIDELNAEIVVARAEADRALAEERQRADRLSERVEALSSEVLRAEKQTEAVVGRAERAEAGRDAERARVEALRDRLDAIQAQLAVSERMREGRSVAGRGSGRRGGESRGGEVPRARKPTGAASDLRRAVRRATTRRAEAARRLRSLWARLRAAWRGE